jgi:hypothetical protein
MEKKDLPPTSFKVRGLQNGMAASISLGSSVFVTGIGPTAKEAVERALTMRTKVLGR